MIPMVFHFCFFQGQSDRQWLDVHTLCLKSCQDRSGVERIIVHYDREGTGEHWNAAKSLSNIEWRATVLDWTINEHQITDYQIMSDYYRLQTLYKEGGFFCNLDFVFLKPFNLLRHYPAVIGTQCKQKMKLSSGLIACVPSSSFVKAYIDSYKEWTPPDQKKSYTFTNDVPWKLSQEYAVHVIPRSGFYPVAWSNKTFWFGQHIPMKNSYAIHLWETLHPELSVDILKKTCLADEISKIMKEPLKHSVVHIRSGILSFD
jgi:hypothetical protein